MTGPGTEPLFKVTVAFPLTVDAVAVVGDASMSPIYSPPADGSLPPLGPVMTKLTCVPSTTGVPFISFTRNITAEDAGCPPLLSPIT